MLAILGARSFVRFMCFGESPHTGEHKQGARSRGLNADSVVHGDCRVQNHGTGLQIPRTAEFPAFLDVSVCGHENPKRSGSRGLPAVDSNVTVVSGKSGSSHSPASNSYRHVELPRGW